MEARLPSPGQKDPWFWWGENLIRAIGFSLNPIQRAMPLRSSARLLPMTISVPSNGSYAVTPPVPVPVRCILRASQPGFGAARMAGTASIIRSPDMVAAFTAGTITFPAAGKAVIDMSDDASWTEPGFVWLAKATGFVDFSVTLLFDRE